jgi:hypothetical protein
MLLYESVIKFTDDEKFNTLKTLWMDSRSGNPPSGIAELAKPLQGIKQKGKTYTADEIAMLRNTRVELTKLILRDSPTMCQMEGQLEKLLLSTTWKNGDDSGLAQLVDINVRAHEKMSSARSNIVFSFLHLISLNLKAPVINNIESALTTHALAAKDAMEAISAAKKKDKAPLDEIKVKTAYAVSQKNAKIDKAMLRHAALGQMTAHIRKRIEYSLGTDTIDPDRTRSSLLCESALNEMPDAIRSLFGWSKVKERMQSYTHHTADIEGEHFRSLLSSYSEKLPELLGSFKVYSKLQSEIEEKMVFERQLWNIQNDQTHNYSTASAANKDVVGVETSYANKERNRAGMPTHPALQPGNQLALAMLTPLRTNSGKVRDVLVLSCVAPALDSREQPDFENYVATPDPENPSHTKLNVAAYRKAFETIAEQVMQCAKDNPQCPRIVLPGIGMNSFLAALTIDGKNEDQKEVAIGIGCDVLAKLVTDLRAIGKEVVFTDGDTKSERLDDLNTRLGDKPLTMHGAIPGDWINDNDLIVNAWDPHSLVGNKLAKDNSIDGFIGRNSLLHFMHGLHCAAHAEGVKLARSQN